jgi:hypothetical protein
VKLVSPEALTEPQSSILNGYSRFFPAGAVCVNVMLGDEPWDLRPLLLSLGKVSIARFSMSLNEATARSIASELEGFSALCNAEQRVQLLPGEGRFMLLRPYFAETLKDEIGKGALVSERHRLDLVQSLIRQVAELSRRNIVHGHISPSNIIRDGSNLRLVDPVVGALHQTADSYLAPETSLGKTPEAVSDLYGLGRTIAILLGESLSARQRSVVEQLMLPTPRQRPPLEEIAVVLGVGSAIGNSGSDSGDLRAGKPVRSSGRLLKPGTSTNIDRVVEHSSDRSAEGDAQGPAKKSGSLLTALFIGGVVLVGGIWILKDRYPAVYFELTSRFPMLAAQHSAQYEEEWASRDRARMAVVGRAGVIRRETAAINTIVNDLIAGENPDGVHGSLMRVALSDEWRNELTPADKHAALVFALEGLVPEGRAQLPTVAGLHPGVVLAVLGQTPIKSIPVELRQLPIEILTRLPAPFGDLFSQVRAMGVKQAGDSTVVGLAEIVTGNPNSQAFERFLGRDAEAARILAKVSLVFPIVSASDAAASELLAVLGERDGEITTLVRWFDLVDVAGWGTAKAADKVSLILGNLPQSQLSVAQLGDLLAFPIEKVRNQAGLKLREVFPGPEGERLLITLATPAVGLTREQKIALISALALAPQARAPFVSAWFDLAPSADAVLLILLARSNVDSQDLFNLEAARYLRRTSWNANLDILKLLASHPEPLARLLAYGRLDPSIDEGRSVLLERQRLEKDESCLKALKDRVESFKKS